MSAKCGSAFTWTPLRNTASVWAPIAAWNCWSLRSSACRSAPPAAEIGAALEKEAGEILKAIPQDAYVVALCVEGKELPSEAMAELVEGRENSGKPKLCFVVGGSFGLSETVKKRADLRLSMSKMTFPHHLARIMLAEQLYRGYKIREGSRYHK